MRRFLATATLAAIGLSLTVPLIASAHPHAEHGLKWTQSPDPTTAGDHSEVWSNDEIVAATADFLDGVSRWDVVIRPANGGTPSTCREEFAPNDKGEFPKQILIYCPWDTTRATEHTLPGPTPFDRAQGSKEPRVWQSRDLGPSVNGRYTIEITVWNSGAHYNCGLLLGCREPLPGGSQPHQLYDDRATPQRWREVFVVNGVAEPTGVASAFDPTTNRIGVTWSANPEPDATYVVQERIGDGKWSSGVAVPANRYERTLDQPGKYQYRVAAVRPAPNRDNANATKRSAYVAAAAVEVAQITPPSTAGAPAGADGAPDGGEPGVFVPTDPTSPTTGKPPAAKPAKSSKSSRPGGSTARPAGTSSRSTGSTGYDPGEAEGEGPDEGYSTELPYNRNQGDPLLAEDEEGEEIGPQTLAGGVVPKPRDTRQLLIFMAGALTLFVFAMQLTVLLRRSRPALAPTSEHYHDDFDDWLGF
ncbi:MAG: hypothetical protein AB1679_10555 [Actinomycetota bacterium]|jgi:hypothetical protein